MLHSMPPPFGGRYRPIYPCWKASATDPKRAPNAPQENPLKWRYPVLIFGGICCSAWGFIYRPFPMPGEEPLLDLLLYHTPNFYIWVVRWYYVAPAVAVVVGWLIVSTIYHV